MSFTVRKLGSALGAEIIGLDLTSTLDDGTVAALRAAWSEHLILLFRDQPLTPRQQIAFSRCFGELDDHAAIPKFRHPEHPEILMVNNLETATQKRLSVGRQWHSDLSTTLRPAKGSLLHAIQLPSTGGDTMFCNMYRAWEGLSPLLREWLDGREAVHDMSIARETRLQRTESELEEIRRRNPPVCQPVCRVHETTGRKALYVSEMTTSHIDGLTMDESQAILEHLYRQSTAHENVYRHIWRKGDSVLWDNRCVMHIALSDYDPSEIRTMHRTTLMGNPSGRLAHVS
ncbi:TauD/TfdA family dioxygenase [Alcaligenaceae bacterium]|nr:TauD/TfdA family dioxygenase [Alcaligenaceae bacterium]